MQAEQRNASRRDVPKSQTRNWIMLNVLKNCCRQYLNTITGQLKWKCILFSFISEIFKNMLELNFCFPLNSIFRELSTNLRKLALEQNFNIQLIDELY